MKKLVVTVVMLAMVAGLATAQMNVTLKTSVSPTTVKYGSPVTFRAMLKGLTRPLPAGQKCYFTVSMHSRTSNMGCIGMPFAMADFKQQGNVYVAETKVTFRAPRNPRPAFTVYISSATYLRGSGGMGHHRGRMGRMMMMGLIRGTTVPLVFPKHP